MPTLYLIDGFEHGLATATTGTGPYDAVVGSPTTVTTPVRTGARALEITAAGAAEYVGYTFPTTNRDVTSSFYVRFATLPTTDGVKLCQFFTAGGSSHGIAFRTAANGGPCLATSASGTYSNISGTISTGTWYRVDVRFNTSANPHVVTARVDGGTEASSNTALAASDISGGRLGTNIAETITCYYDDWMVSLAGATDYPIGPHYVEQLLPTGDGAHNVNGANTFERSATGTDITNATTDAYLLVDDATIDTTPTDYINQVAGANTDYVEVTFANPATQTDTPGDVRGYVAYQDSVATGTTTSGCDFYDTDTTYATLSTAVKAHADTGNTTIRTFSNSAANSHLLTRPSGGWNITKVNALRARVGYGDGAPDGWFSTVMAEVAMFPPAVLQVDATLINQTGVIFTPTVLNPQTVAASLIDQSGVTFAPTVNIQVQIGLIDQTAQTFAPTVNQQVQASLIDQTGATFAPTVSTTAAGQTVTVPYIGAYGGYEQGYATGGYAIFPPGVSIPAAPATYPSLIDRTGQVFAPSVAQQVQVSFIDQSGATFAPQVSPAQSISPGLISQLGATFTPSVNVAGGAQSVSPPLLSYGQVFTPEVRPAQLVNPPLISSTGQTFAPTVSIPSSQSIQVGLISQAGGTFAPSVSIPGSQSVVIPLISRAGTLFEPAILPAQLVNAPFISSIGTVFIVTVASGEMGAPVDYPMAVELVTIGAATEQVSEGKATMYVEQGEAT